MAGTNQFLYQYRWGVAAVGVVAIAMGGLWLASRSDPVEVVAVEEPTIEPVDEVVVSDVPVAVSEPTVEEMPIEPDVEDAAQAEPTVEAEISPDVAEAVVEEPAPQEPAPVIAVEAAAVEAAPMNAAPVEPAPENDVAAVEPAPEAVAPKLDLVRVEPDGSAVVAGQAEPGSQVDITVDGEVVATATATETGEFVAFVETDAEAGAKAIQAVGEDEVGVDLVSADTVLVLTPEVPAGETAAPVVVSATEDAIVVLQPGGLAVPDQVSLDSISYDKAGEAILAGRAQPLSEVRIYVDDVFAVSAKASDSGAWTTPLNQVAAGRYILRVDEIGPDGAVTSRAQTPFQKEYPENIAPFLQMANGKLTVQPGNTLWVMAREIYGSGTKYTQIFAANKDNIGDPNLIFPGQIFDIPEEIAP